MVIVLAPTVSPMLQHAHSCYVPLSFSNHRFCAFDLGPWILKAGWGPLARVEFAIEAGIASKDRPSSIYTLVRRSRVAFARQHHPAYEEFLRRRLQEEEIEGQGGEEEGGGQEEGGGEALHPLAWRSSAVQRDAGAASSSSLPRNPELDSEPGEVAATASAAAAAVAAAGKGTRTARLESAGAQLQNVVSASGDEGEEEHEEGEEDILKRRALEVAGREDALGRGRKSRLAGVKDRPPNLPQPLARLRGSPQEGDALLDLGQEEIVAYDSPTPQQRRLGA